jgi:hypothetical protein
MGITIVMETRADVRAMATIIRCLDEKVGLKVRKRSEALNLIVSYFAIYLKERFKEDIYTYEDDDEALAYLGTIFGPMFGSRKNAMYLGRQLLDNEVIDVFKATASPNDLAKAVKMLEGMQTKEDIEREKAYESL